MEFPEENELVIVTIKKIMPYGAFCKLTEYPDAESFLHISEVAPRWIKNIHEFISEGQTHVAKVYRLDKEKSQIDISLKRVSDEEKKRKLESFKTSKRTAKLLELCIKNSKLKLDIKEVREEIEKAFPDVYSCFESIVEVDETVIDEINLPKALKKQIVEIAKKNIKKSQVGVGGIIHLTCYDGNGIENIKTILSSISSADLNIHYLGAPRYKISLTAKDYKEGEKRLEKLIENLQGLAKKHNCLFSFKEDN